MRFSVRSLTGILLPIWGSFSAASLASTALPGGQAATATPEVSARAEDTWVTTARVQLPLSRLTVWHPSADSSISMGGFSINERFRDLFEAEAGADYGVNPCARGWQITGRAGVAPALFHGRPRGGAWDLRLPLLASYHHLGLSGDSCDGRVDKSVHLLMVSAGLDATHWTAGGWGFDIRLLVGAGRAWESAREGNSSGGALDGGLSFGLAY